MEKLYFYNTLTRKKEIFEPIKKTIGIYSCGPTVYWNQHIGHMYAYVQWDSMIKTLNFLGYKTKWVMNITDVGHLTSDEDAGEDKMEKGAKREGISVWQLADKYIAQFQESLKLLNISKPDILCRATKHIPEQIKLAQKIEKNNFTYQTKAGLIFDTQKFPLYNDFAKLDATKQKMTERMEADPEKKNPQDFHLWFSNQPNHIMQWSSPWGKGFPGWHLECTAMSTKYLGESFDIHTGGQEHISIHHTNEIAQAYAAFGHQTANYWLHNGWLLFEGKKMSKSDGTSILASELPNKGFNPLSLRYLIFSSHYHQGLDFNWQALEASQTALNRLYDISRRLFKEKDHKKTNKNEFEKWQKRFLEAITNDLNFPQAIATTWEMLKSDLSNKEKYKLLLAWDKIFSLNIKQESKIKIKNEIPKQIQDLMAEREKARKNKEWQKSDELREKIKTLGFEINDTSEGQKINKI